MNLETPIADVLSSARQLADAPEPVLVFDGTAPPILVWANAAALAFLGAPRTAILTLPDLDRAMPAMARIRELARGDIAAAGRRLDLVFWTPKGARTLVCQCRQASFAFATEALIVHGQSEVAKAEQVHAAAEPAHKSATSGAPIARTVASSPARADFLHAATLNAIASQIRNGGQHEAPLPQQTLAVEEAQPAAPDAVVALGRHGPDFLARISHEIRTPLNSILGFSEIMREERLGAIGNAKYRTYASDIHESATHALSLVNDLLDLSRVEAGGLDLEPVELDAGPIIAAAVGSLQPQAEKAEVALSAPLPRRKLNLVCDARSLKQMLLNLLSNAIRHTDPGGSVWVTAGPELGSASECAFVIRVQDTGVGMTPEELVQALEPYTQIGAIPRRAGGSGLGLPLTKALATANGATLRLESIAGGGLAALLVFERPRG